MNTVEELRKAFAQGHVLKGVDWIFSLASALEERVERIELANLANAGIRLKEQEFLATVEERIGRLESKDAKFIPRAIVDRLAALEHWRNDGADEAWAGETDARLDLLEAAAQENPERERKADWKRTYNAVLPELLRLCVEGCHNDDADGEEEDPGEAAHRLATWHADRAHGPLEAKAIDVDKRLTELQDEAVFKRSEVEALVKAARHVRQLLLSREFEAACVADREDLGPALKPFESVKP